jgi:hypothetical protein
MATKTIPLPLPLSTTFAPMSARRLLVFGGIALVAVGMLFGDIFAVFILHQNAGQQGAALLAASQAVADKNPSAVNDAFTHLGSLLESRGTKVDAHVHMIGGGYLALLLALLQPYIALSTRAKKVLAAFFIIGGTLLPVGIFLIHYVGLAYSPFSVIGWASVVADSAGALLIVALLGELWGLMRYTRSAIHTPTEAQIPDEDTWQRRALLSGGTWLILLGFLHGAWYAAFDLYAHEAQETTILGAMLEASALNNMSQATEQVVSFGNLAGAKAVNIAAHSHIIEFGLLAILLSFIQPFVFLSDRWKGRMVKLLLGGSVILPVFVLLELKWGLVAGGIADAGGLLVVIALVGMLVGVLRYSGSLDATGGLR